MNTSNSTKQRIQQLEKQVQQFQRLSLLSLLSILAFILMSVMDKPLQDTAKNANADKDNLRARSLSLVNEQGKVVLTLRAEALAGLLTINNNEGQEIISLGADSKGQGSLLQMSNPKSDNMIQIRSNAENSAVKLYDNDRKSMIYLGEDKRNKGAGYLFLSENGQQKMMFDTHEGMIHVANEDSKTGFVQFPKKN